MCRGCQLSSYNYKFSHIRFGKFPFTYIHQAQIKNSIPKTFKAQTGSKIKFLLKPFLPKKGKEQIAEQSNMRSNYSEHPIRLILDVTSSGNLTLETREPM